MMVIQALIRRFLLPWLFLFHVGKETLAFQLQPSQQTKGSNHADASSSMSGWQLFDAIFHASASISGNGDSKTNGVPSVVLQAIAQAAGRYLPSARAHGTGCIVAANHLTGPSAKGTYDLLLPPATTKEGQQDEWCVAPTMMNRESNHSVFQGESLKMQWMSKGRPMTKAPMPSVEDVFETVFLRQEPSSPPVQKNAKPSLNFWFLSFVNWFHDDNFRTAPHSDGGFLWSDTGGLHMAQLYGHTEYRQRALRSFRNGKMKTSQGMGWDSMPPKLVDVQAEYPDFDMWTPLSGSAFNSTGAGKETESLDLSLYFAVGDPRFNMHPGHIVWTSISLHIHNAACDILKTANPQFQDEDLFQRARVITFHIVQKIRLQDFVSDSVSHARDFVRIVYDPPTLREQLGPHFRFASSRPNFLEFNHVYQAWHSLIPDALLLNETNLSIRDLMWNPELFSQTSFQEIAQAFSDTPMSHYGPHSFPPFLRGVTTDALRNARSQRMQGYNAYRRFLGMDPLHSFEQFSVHDPNKMKDLYMGDIDSVEFLTGVLADTNATLPGNLIGDVQLIMVALLALQDTVSNDVVLNPLLWSADYLTQEGLDFVKNFEIRDVIWQLTGKSDNYCPFQTNACGFASYTEPDKVQARFFKKSRVCSFVNLNVALVDWFWVDNGYMRLLALYLTTSIAAMLACYVLVFTFFSWLLALPKYSDSGDFTEASGLDSTTTDRSSSSNDHVFMNRIRLTCLWIGFLLSFALTAPLSIFAVDFLSDPYWIQNFAADGHRISWATAATAAHFMAEGVYRLALWRSGQKSGSLLFLHHMGFFFLMGLTIGTRHVGVFKLAYTLLAMWSWEWSLYFIYATVRLLEGMLGNLDADNVRPALSTIYSVVVRHVAFVGILIYFSTRVLGVVAIILLATCGCEGELFWLAVSVALLLVGLQFYAGWDLASFRHRRLLTLANVQRNVVLRGEVACQPKENGA